MPSVSKQESQCCRCRTRILIGQQIGFDQVDGRWKPHHDPCPSNSPVLAVAPMAAGAPAASASYSDWSVSVEEHVTDDPNVPRVTITKISRIRINELEVESTIHQCRSSLVRTRP